MGAMLQAFMWWLLPIQLEFITLFAFIMVIAVSYGFELFSKITGMGRYDFIDAVASAIGGVLGMGIILLVVFLL